MRLDARVVAVSRRGHDLMRDDDRVLAPFIVQVAERDGAIAGPGGTADRRRGAVGIPARGVGSQIRRLRLDATVQSTPSPAPLIDPNIHSCGTVRPHGGAELRHPEPNFWIVGMKSHGRAPTFLLTTRHEQGRSIVAALAGD